MQILEKTFWTDRGTIYYWTCFAGGNLPWLIFLPGLTADRHLFDRQIVELGWQYNCLVWDAPGHGKSRPFVLKFTMDDLAEYLFRILQAEGIRRPVVVGQSMGGLIAQVFMERYPETVAGFVAIDSCPMRREFYTDAELWMLKHTEQMYLSIPWQTLIKWGARGTAETPYGRSVMRWMMKRYERKEFCALAAYGYQIMAEAVETGRNCEIRCPVLLLCGEKDAAGSARRYNRNWARKMGHTLIWVPGAGHNCNTDQPKFVNWKIDQFVGACIF